MTTVQNCLLCAWRENCAKRFRVSDGGARCPDYSRDVTVRVQPENTVDSTEKEQEK